MPIAEAARTDLARDLCRQSLERYGSRIRDNLDLDRPDNPDERARVIASALIRRGDARAFVPGRRILDAVGTWRTG